MKKPRNLTARALCALFACLILPSTQAGVDIFLQMEGVEGESQDDKHKNQIEILSYSWGAQSITDPTTGAGKFVNQSLQFLKHLDKSSAKLAQTCANGTHFLKGTITVRKRGSRQIEFVRYSFEDILVSGYSISAHGSTLDRPMESLSLNFAKVGVEYFTIAPLGTIADRDAFAWDFVLNGAATLAFPPSLDADEDTIPDDWERAFQLDPALNDATLDKDLDGATNVDEYIAGTDPTTGDQVFKATLNFQPGARTAQLTFPSAPERNYQILIGSDLNEPFQPYLTVPSAGESTTINVPGLTALNQFYRVEIVP
jgi:type VI secretion system secreted protein Hcp